MGENKGPAGGFYEGIKLAYEGGHDLFWTFDDDCRPASAGCLQSLLELCKNNPAPGMIKPLVQDPDTKAYMGSGPWHGALFSREVVSSVGFPKKELFFGSEDIEYELRIRRKGFYILKIRCEGSLIHHHVPIKRSFNYLLKHGYDDPPWRVYYTVRGVTWLKIQKHRF
jgi:GT2 family glycosyltransferase